MNLKEIVPWGRNMSEYVDMFSLDTSMSTLSILGCGDGPASFNAEATVQGWNVISADPVYRFSKTELAARIEEVREEVMREVRKEPSNYVWQKIASPDALETIRMNTMRQFVMDYEYGTKQGRYIEASLPSLPFADKQFDLALCSHFLFLYSTQFSESDHLASIQELCRVAKEIRIYPLLSVENNATSHHLAGVMSHLKSNGYEAELVPVPYEFQKGAIDMLKIS